MIDTDTLAAAAAAHADLIDLRADRIEGRRLIANADREIPHAEERSRLANVALRATGGSLPDIIPSDPEDVDELRRVAARFRALAAGA